MKIDNAKTTGLRYWMLRTLEECDNAAVDFKADPVHDLRVSLRRCRSMADGMMAMDPDKEWKQMKKAGKKLFQSLGALRDVQIMMEWIDKLELHEADPDLRVAGTKNPSSEDSQPEEKNSESSDAQALTTASSIDHEPAAQALLRVLQARELEQKQEARAALELFDKKQWRQWSKSLPLRAARIRPGSAVFKHLALERWTAARELHVRALRNRSQVALHTLRIGIKRFRYIVENFLPQEHKLWSNDLKHMQDLLGEVHDLDVLWATAVSCHVFTDESSRKSWHERILKERSKRVDEYRQSTVGSSSLWDVWRQGLPQGKQIPAIATQRLKLWAKALDPDFAHSERVARLALQLYDGMVRSSLLSFQLSQPSAGPNNATKDDVRVTLYEAALLHDIGKAKGDKGHHKESLDLIKKYGAPLGLKPGNMARAALIARFHCGALPRRNHKALRDLLPEEQKLIIRLSAILRLANALDSEHDGRVRRVIVERNGPPTRRSNGFLRAPVPLAKNEAVIVVAEGYADGTPTAQTVAAERYLMEMVLRHPVIVKPSHATRHLAVPHSTLLA